MTSKSKTSKTLAAKNTAKPIKSKMVTKTTEPKPKKVITPIVGKKILNAINAKAIQEVKAVEKKVETVIKPAVKKPSVKTTVKKSPVTAEDMVKLNITRIMQKVKPTVQLDSDIKKEEKVEKKETIIPKVSFSELTNIKTVSESDPFSNFKFKK